MVDKEEIAVEDLVANRTKCDPIKLYRHPAGDWTAVIDVDLEFDLGDGRVVRFAGDVRIKGRQSGHRPRANAFGRDGNRPA